MSAYEVHQIDDDAFQQAMDAGDDALVDRVTEFMLDGVQTRERLDEMAERGLFLRVAEVDGAEASAPLAHAAQKTRNASEGVIWWSEKPDVLALRPERRSTRPGDLVVAPDGGVYALRPDGNWTDLGARPDRLEDGSAHA